MSNNSAGSGMTMFIGFVIVFVFAFAGGVYMSKFLGGDDSKYGASTQGEAVKKPARASGLRDRSARPRRLKRRAPDETPLEMQEPEAGTGETQGAKIEIDMGEAPVKREELMAPGVEEVIEPVSPPTKSPEPRVAVIMEPVERKAPPLPRRLRDRGKYTVQVGSFLDEKEAKRVERLLKSRGYPAFTKKAIVAGKGTWYRVRVGTFVSRGDAKSYGEVLKSSENDVKDIFITINN